MKPKKLLILFLSMISLSSISLAQPTIDFKFESHDFGVITEGELATIDFEFTNNGDKPLILSNVKPSCGCTTPNWPKDSIQPGQSSKIKVTYNSKGRPGGFFKSIYVTSNATNTSLGLKIKGIVIKPLMAEFSKEELKKSPVLTLERTSHDFGKIEVHKTQTYSFTVKNSGKNPLVIKDIQAACRCVKFSMEQDTVPAGKSTTLHIQYTPRTLGITSDQLVILSNDKTVPYNTILLNANVVNTLLDNNLLRRGGGIGF